MENKTELLQKAQIIGKEIFNHIGEDKPFDFNEKSQKQNIFYSWGCKNFRCIVHPINNEMFGIRFHVNGYKHKGFIEIYKVENDKYLVRFINNEKTAMPFPPFVTNGDNLQSRIDEVIEKQDEYQY